MADILPIFEQLGKFLSSFAKIFEGLAGVIGIFK